MTADDVAAASDGPTPVATVADLRALVLGE
jgi:hypothetical protein